MKEFLQNVKNTLKSVVMNKNFLFGFIAGAVIVGFITWNDAVQAAIETLTK